MLINKVKSILALALLATSFSAPLAAEVPKSCQLRVITDFPVVAEFISAINDADYLTAARIIQLGNSVPERTTQAKADQFRSAFQNTPVRTCRIYQHRRFSDDFKTEVVLIETGAQNIHMFVAAMQRDSDWQVLNFVLKTSIQEIFQYIK